MLGNQYFKPACVNRCQKFLDHRLLGNYPLNNGSVSPSARAIYLALKLVLSEGEIATLKSSGDSFYTPCTRYSVASPTPNSREIERQETPEARRAAILAASTTRRGLPRRFPFA